ncbi:MAG: Arm DNA-binding domain-containing protein, partial [Lepagella sp.]
MTKKKTKELVYLRRRERSNGNIALFLDMTAGGLRKHEYLNLYLVPERTREDRARNRETLALAESIKAQRIVELQQVKFGIESPVTKDVLFYDYLQVIIDRKDGTTKTSWEN